MKNLTALLVAITLILSVTACSGDTVEPTGAVSPVQSANGSETTNQNTGTASSTVSVDYDSDDLDASWNSAEASHITLSGDSVTIDGDGVVFDGSQLTIDSAGTYSLSGILDDGQIVVDTEDKETVKLVLNGADITCSASAPIYIVNAEKVVITLANGTENYLTDGDSYIFEDAESDEPNAAIFSNDDLTINGSGLLTVEANYNNGIQSNDGLKITGGNIIVNAANDGIKGRNYIAVKDGNITVDAGGDGMQSNNDEDAEKGFVAIEGGTINITANEDGIQAETNLVVSGGNITISSGGGSANSSTGDNWGTWGPKGMQIIPDNGVDTGSAKGIKAGVDVTITAGTINIDSSDDAIHSNNSLMIDSGSMVLTSGDDGIHSDTVLEINGGDISITKSYEGIESSAITVNGGNIDVVASDDGINAAGGVDGSSINGRPGQNTFNPTSGGNSLSINGGYVLINASGDGLDINGSIDMTDGVVLINGPTANNNGALDYLGDFKVTGGFLVAAGSSGMAMAPGISSTQYSVMVNLTSLQPAGTLFHIETEDGEDILTFSPAEAYQSVVFCSPELENGETYIACTGGSSTGTAADGLYSGGTYNAGIKVASFTISSAVTTIGSSGGGPPGSGRW